MIHKQHQAHSVTHTHKSKVQAFETDNPLIGDIWLFGLLEMKNSMTITLLAFPLLILAQIQYTRPLCC
jgi:hypothetical protein